MAAEIFRAAIEDWNRGDLDAVFARLDPDLEFVASGTLPDIPARLKGDELRRFFRDWLASWERIALEAERLEEHGDRVLALVRFAASGREGVEVEQRFSWLVTIRDGKIAGWSSFADWDEAAAAL
jgi:ketosteroid isomerase-like protein